MVDPDGTSSTHRFLHRLASQLGLIEDAPPRDEVGALHRRVTDLEVRLANIQSPLAELRVSTSDVLWYIDLALDAMTGIVEALGDDRANQAPHLPAANSPYAILTHCLGVLEFWGGFVIAGRSIQRDRDAEFQASGSVAELVRRTRDARRRLAADLSTIEPLAPPRGAPDPDDANLPIGRTQGGVVLHILEELLQHLGQMELTRDVLVS
jgi:hypothetical protein